MGVGKTRDRNSDIFIDGQNVKVLGGVGCSARHAENGGGVGWGWDEGGGDVRVWGLQLIRLRRTRQVWDVFILSACNGPVYRLRTASI